MLALGKSPQKCEWKNIIFEKVFINMHILGKGHEYDFFILILFWTQ